MKKLLFLLTICFLIIFFCLFYLLKNGVSLRAATLIKPSVVHENWADVAQGVAYRMFPEFQTKHILFVALQPGTPDSLELIEDLREQVSKLIGKDIQWRDSSSALADCQKNCWVRAEEVSDISPSRPAREWAAGQPYTTLTVIGFKTYNAEKAEQCVSQQRLTQECLRELAIREATRKMKDPNRRYFFLKKYNDTDHFLFIRDQLSE